MDVAVVLSMAGLTLAVVVHIAIIARWSGRIDCWMRSLADRLTRVEEELGHLRDGHHDSDAVLQRHEGILQEYRQRSDVADPAAFETPADGC